MLLGAQGQELQQCPPLGAIGRFLPLNTKEEREEFRQETIQQMKSKWVQGDYRFAQSINIGKGTENPNTQSMVSFNYES